MAAVGATKEAVNTPSADLSAAVRFRLGGEEPAALLREGKATLLHGGSVLTLTGATANETPSSCFSCFASKPATPNDLRFEVNLLVLVPSPHEDGERSLRFHFTPSSSQIPAAAANSSNAGTGARPETPGAVRDFVLVFQDAKTWAHFSTAFSCSLSKAKSAAGAAAGTSSASATTSAATATGNPLLSPYAGGAFPIVPTPAALPAASAQPSKVRAHVLARASMNLSGNASTSIHAIVSGQGQASTTSAGNSSGSALPARASSSSSSLLGSLPSPAAASGATSEAGTGATAVAGELALLSPERKAGELGDSGLTRQDFLKRLEDKLKSTAAARNRALSSIASSSAPNTSNSNANNGGAGGGGGITGLASVDVALLPSLPSFDAPTPPPDAPAALHEDYKDRKYRHHVYTEILESEKRYFRDLQVLQSVFEVPLRNASMGSYPILLPHEVEMVFSNLDQLIEIHAALLQALCENLPPSNPSNASNASAKPGSSGSVMVMSPGGKDGAGAGLFSEIFAEAFSRVVPFCRLHAVFASRYWAALKLIKKKRQRAALLAKKGKRKSKTTSAAVSANKRSSVRLSMASPGQGNPGDRKSIATGTSSSSSSGLPPGAPLGAAAMPAVEIDEDSLCESFADFLELTLLKPETRRLEIEGFLIMPIQRLCRYPLLLKDLLRHMPQDHPNRKKISAALAEVEKIAGAVNDKLQNEHRATLLLELHDLLDRSVPDLILPTRQLVLDLDEAVLSFPLDNPKQGGSSFFDLFSSPSSSSSSNATGKPGYRVVILTDLLILARFSHIGSRHKFGNGDVVEESVEEDDAGGGGGGGGGDGSGGKGAALSSAHLAGWLQKKRYKVLETIPLKDVTVVGGGEFGHRHKRSRSGVVAGTDLLAASSPALRVPTPAANRILKLTASKVVAPPSHASPPSASPAKEKDKKKTKKDKDKAAASASDQLPQAEALAPPAPTVAVLRFDIHFKTGAECEKVGRALVKTINAAVDLARNLEERRAGADQSKVRNWKKRADGRSGGSGGSGGNKNASSASASASTSPGGPSGGGGDEVQQQLEALRVNKLSAIGAAVPPLAGFKELPPSPGNPNRASSSSAAAGGGDVAAPADTADPAATGAGGGGSGTARTNDSGASGSLAVWGIARFATADEGSSSLEEGAPDNRSFATPNGEEGDAAEGGLKSDDDDNPARFIRSSDEEEEQGEHGAGPGHGGASGESDDDDENEEADEKDGDAAAGDEPGGEEEDPASTTVTFFTSLSSLLFGGLSALTSTVASPPNGTGSVTAGSAMAAATAPHRTTRNSGAAMSVPEHDHDGHDEENGARAGETTTIAAEHAVVSVTTTTTKTAAAIPAGTRPNNDANV